MALDYVGGHGKGGKGQGKPNLFQVRSHTCGKLGHNNCWQKSSAAAASSKGSPSSGSNSKAYPKRAPQGFKDKGKGKSLKGKSKGKMKGKQQAMEGEEQVTEVSEETWQEDDGQAGQWPEGEWEEPVEQGAMGAMFTYEGRSDSYRHRDREIHMREKNWFTMPFVSLGVQPEVQAQ